MASDKVGVSKCPKCGHVLELETGIERNADPSPGDFGVCIQCAVVLRFDDDLKRRIATIDELKALSVSQPDLIRQLELVQTAIKHIRAKAN